MDHIFWTVAFQIVPILGLLYYFINRKYSYWTEQGILGPKPNLLDFGNLVQIESAADVFELEAEWAQKYGSIYGIYHGMEPILTVTDPEWVKQILVKDFHLFTNRRHMNTMHELVNSGQFFAEGDDWKKMRTISGPTFTSGKLRKMLPLMNDCIDNLKVFIQQKIDQNGGVIETKKVMTGVGIEVITSAVFATATKANSVTAEDRANPVVTHAMSLMESSSFRVLSFLSFPRWFNTLIGIRYPFRVDSFNYLTSMVAEIIRQRKAQGKISRNDFVQLLMDASVDESELKGDNFERLTASIDTEETTNKKQATNGTRKTTLTEKEIISQCMVFYVAGFETTSASLSNAFFELSQNGDIQERLHCELTEALDGLDRNSDAFYETIMSKIPYLDAFVKECLRKYPPLKRLERRLTGADEYQIGKVTLKRGQMIQIPTVEIQRNALFYSEPERFNPDRFMPPNKDLLVPYTYLSFGAGPRNCIGMRFAYQELKLVIAQMVQQFTFETTAQTPSKLTFKKYKPTLNVDPFHIKVAIR